MQPSAVTLNRPSPTIARALALSGADLKRVDALILERVGVEVPLIRDVAKHIIASGGKRLRPMLTLLSAKLCGYTGEFHVHLATAVELIHTATLLHDDVVDESKLRRGMATANAQFGNQASVLVGDFLLAQAFRLMVETGSQPVLSVLSEAAATIARGEVKQLMCGGNPALPEETYMDVVSCKTAALFAAACEIGAVAAKRADAEAALREFGQNVGIAFQLVDDALDYVADEAQLGKTVGDDFREGKITLPVILAFRAGNEEEERFWNRAMAERRQESGDLAQATLLLQKYHAIDSTLALARRYCDAAACALQPFPESPTKSALLEIVDFCAGRVY